MARIPTAIYDYTNQVGDLLFQVCRYEPKDFRQRRPDGNGGWIWNLHGVEKTIFRLPAILAAVQFNGWPIFVCEGEKDVLSVVDEGLPATCSPGGAGKWVKKYADYFIGAEVVVLPHNDESGRKHALKVATSVFGKATCVKILELPGLLEKGDVSDWLAAGHGKAELLELAENCELWQPPPEPAKEIQKAEPGELRAYNRTDAGTAAMLADRFGQDIRCVYPAGYWHIWDGRRWRRDNGAKVKEYFTELTTDMLLKAAEEKDDGRESLLKWAAYLGKTRNRNGALEILSTGLAELKAMAADLDSDPMRLNCLNGTLDLHTGELRSHNRADMISRLCPVEYHAGAQSRTWNDFLETVLPDPDVQRYVQKAAGYSLTGDISEEKLFFAYGPPATGKSTFLSAVQAAIGEYAITTDFNSFLASRLRQGGPRSDIAGLSGYRLVSSIEVEDGQHMAEGVLSLLSGGDRISARFLHKEFFEFTPTFKIWLAANNRPDVSSGESALWRRLKLLPFDQVIAKPDPAVKKILSNPAKSGAAVMAWLVDGCLAWQQEGLKPEPDAIRALTEDYRHESDPLRDFIEECCLIQTNSVAGKQEIYDKYREYCETTHEKYPLGQKHFNKRLFNRGFREVRMNNIRVWKNIKLSGKLF